MAAPTNTELILQLRDSVAALEGRINNLDDRLKRLETSHDKTTDLGTGLDKRLAVIESLVTEQRKQLDETDRRRFAVMIMFLGSVATLIVNLALLALRKTP